MENKKEKKSIVDRMVSDLMEIYYRDYVNLEEEPSPKLTEKQVDELMEEVEKAKIQKKIDDSTQGRGLY